MCGGTWKSAKAAEPEFAENATFRELQDALNYPFRMANHEPFTLPEFMLSHFNRVDFGGDQFDQWPVGIRFEIGLKQVSRAAKLYEFVFAKAEDSQDWITDGTLAKPYTPLFRTPGIFPCELSQFQAVEVSPFDESQYRLTWTRLSRLDFDAEQMFQAIANREQYGLPKVSSGVFVIDPRFKGHHAYVRRPRARHNCR